MSTRTPAICNQPGPNIEIRPGDWAAVCCTRPRGHDGKHAYSTLQHARIAEWDDRRANA